jgi:hypothetical protein
MLIEIDAKVRMGFFFKALDDKVAKEFLISEMEFFTRINRFSGKKFQVIGFRRVSSLIAKDLMDDELKSRVFGVITPRVTS